MVILIDRIMTIRGTHAYVPIIVVLLPTLPFVKLKSRVAGYTYKSVWPRGNCVFKPRSDNHHFATPQIYKSRSIIIVLIKIIIHVRPYDYIHYCTLHTNLTFYILLYRSEITWCKKHYKRKSSDIFLKFNIKILTIFLSFFELTLLLGII